jgi:hypothetical protein
MQAAGGKGFPYISVSLGTNATTKRMKLQANSRCGFALAGTGGVDGLCALRRVDMCKDAMFAEQQDNMAG